MEEVKKLQEDLAIALERINTLEGEVSSNKAKSDKLFIRLIENIEKHQHLPSGVAALPFHD